MLLAGNAVPGPSVVLNPRELLWVLKKQFLELYLVRVLPFHFTLTHVGFHECFLAGRFGSGAAPVHGLNVRVPPALVSCPELEANTLFICSGELQKLPELWWEGRY